MKYICAHALLVLGGNANPSKEDVQKLLQEVGCEVNEEDLHRVHHNLHGKQLHEVVAAGSTKLAALSVGGGSSAGAAAPAGGSKAAEPAKKEEKKEEKKEKEEEADVGLGGGLFGDDEW